MEYFINFATEKENYQILVSQFIWHNTLEEVEGSTCIYALSWFCLWEINQAIW